VRWPSRLATIGCPIVAVVACGRLGFEDRRATGDAVDSFVVDSDSSATVTYVKPIVARHPGGGSGDVFAIQADAPGDFIAMQVGCGDSNMAPSNVSVTAPGWQFNQASPVGAFNQVYAATYYAFAPNSQSASVTVIWSTDCDIGKSVLADEFATQAGSAAFDGVSQPGTTGNCNGTITMQHDGNAVWAACFSRAAVSGIGAGFSPGADNGGGDRAEYKLSTAGAGSNEDVTFPNASDYMLSIIAIRSR